MNLHKSDPFLRLTACSYSDIRCPYFGGGKGSARGSVLEVESLSNNRLHSPVAAEQSVDFGAFLLHGLLAATREVLVMIPSKMQESRIVALM